MRWKKRSKPTPQTIGERLRGEAPDPIAARLLSYALERQDDLLAALDDARRKLGVEADQLGLLLVGESTGLPLAAGAVVVHQRPQLFRIAARLGLDVPVGCTGFFPAIVAHRGEACACWLGPIAGLGGCAA